MKCNITQLVTTTSPDVIIIPGDLPNSLDIPVLLMTLLKGGRRREIIRNSYYRFHERLVLRQIQTAKTLLKDLIYTNIPILLIHGNTETLETRSWLSLYSHRFPNLHWIADNHITIEDTLFYGHGWVPFDETSGRIPSPGEISEEDVKTILLDTIGRGDRTAKKSILISHAPPYKTSIDYLPHKNLHAGSKPVRNMLDSGFFDGVISGHLHEAYGTYYNHKNKWWGVNAGAVIDNIACLIDLSKKIVVWYRKVATNPFDLSKFVYSNRTRMNYDRKNLRT